ncbi:hypothetical protein KR093_009471 [Drosophila rubida]|uniref:Uncharacterized protein n=1 Tax=Drosophila rubida TaxID=30044 RepID=A0AAD4KBD1_9MUSC|nr:hypothetical protein KR093_009471 [Drosophila rubida]
MDLFDMVRAAPPPKNVREHSTAKDANEDNTDAAETAADATSPMEILDDNDGEFARQVVAELQQNLDKGNKDGRDDGKDGDKKDDNDDNNAAADDIVEIVDDDDVPSSSKRNNQDAGNGRVRPFVVRVKRMSRAEIEAYQKPLTPKRGRPRKRAAGDAAMPSQPSVSPPKKSRSSQGKVHIKLRPNGDDRADLPKRAQTPPARSPTKMASTSKAAAAASLAKMTSSSTATTPSNVSGFVSKSMIKRYGKRFFNCFVRVKRLQHSDKRQTNIRRNSSPSTSNKSNKRKSKSKLSVSFSEAVEIFGSSPPKSASSSMTASTSGGSSSRGSVPTRLQRVDATGNVVEDIELPRLSTERETAPKRSRASSSCNGRDKRSGKSKRSLRVPVSGLASLSIDDSQDANDDNNEATDEYIVPNELPEQRPVTTGVRRIGTPTPQVRRLTTTTISDDEDADTAESAKVQPGKSKDIACGPSTSRDAKLARPDPAAKKSKSKTPEPQKPLATQTDKTLAKQTTQPEEPKPPESKDAAKSAQPAAEVPKTVAAGSKAMPKADDTDDIEVIEDDDQELVKLHWTPDVPSPTQSGDDDELEPGEIVLTQAQKAELRALAARRKELSDNETDSDSDTDNDSGSDGPEPGEIVRPKPPPKEVVASTPKEKVQPDDKQQQDDGKSAIKPEPETTPKSDGKRELVSPVSLDVTTDDILEIRTSLEDERDLTLNSPCLPAQPGRNRNLSLESPDSHASSKSATRKEVPGNEVPAPLRVEGGPGLNDNAEGQQVSASSSSAATAQQQPQPQPQQQQNNIFNGTDEVAGVSNLEPESFSAIDEMPNLDVADLGQLVEPDFQMSNSRNANSRDTPDDIMKLLES